MFSQAIYRDIVDIKTDIHEQIWFKLRSVPHVNFCGAYIAPSDTAYFQEESFPRLEAKTLDQDQSYVIMGDMNTRCGLEISGLVADDDGLEYAPTDAYQNSNGRKLISICSANSLLPVNNLRYGQKYFQGSKTFRKRNNWISELDYCVVSRKLALYCVDEFVYQF